MNKFILPLALMCSLTMGVMLVSDTAKGYYNFSVSSEAPEAHLHVHKDISDLDKIPAIALSVTEDPTGVGWNIHIATENFKFTPENVNQENVDNEGHAHLSVDGQKATRIYSDWFYMESFTPGTHLIQVTLHANKHEELVLNGEPILAQVNIVQK